MEFDKLRMYFGEPYEIETPDGQGLTVLQPTIGDIIRIGELRFYATLNAFIANTTSYRLVLWEAGIDWNEISDFDLFLLLYKTVDPEVVNLLFSDINFADFELGKNPNDEMVLVNAKKSVIIDKDVYEHFHRYLQEMFKMKPKDDLTDDRILKDWIILKDRREASRRAEKKDNNSFTMQYLISACVNHPGFKYKLQELRNVGVCEFYDSAQRLQIYESATALMKGMYSGMVDGKKIKPEEYNFMRSI